MRIKYILSSLVTVLGHVVLNFLVTFLAVYFAILAARVIAP